MRVQAGSSYAAAKAQATTAFAVSLVLSVGAHVALFTWNPEFSTQDVSFHSSELTALELPPDVQIPPPPQTIARPATPIVSAADIDDDITIAPTTFEANPVTRIAPPPVAASSEPDLKAAPRFTPYTVSPELRNPEEIRGLLVRTYPVTLRDAGIGGIATLWVFIDETGAVQRALISESSGREALDEAALKVVPEMSFTPAVFQNRRVAVWIELPVQFKAK
jgi:periplasmic protein TonB